MQQLSPGQIDDRVREMLDLVNLRGYERRRVIELSGGEQQRVALARSLAPRPRLLMLDEPLGALDRTLREELMNELRDILKRVGITALYVTHDQEEAFALADRVLIMRARPEQGRGGWIEQEGTPAEVYRRPASEYVAKFLGFRNLLPGKVSAPPTQQAASQWRPDWAASSPAMGGPPSDRASPSPSWCGPRPQGWPVQRRRRKTAFRERSWRPHFAAATTWSRRFTPAASASSVKCRRQRANCRRPARR